MPVSAADGLDVGFADSDPPGVEGAAAAVVVVVVPFPVEAAVVGFVVVAVVVGVVAPPAAVVVVLPPVVVVVDFDFDFDFDPVDEWLLDDFLVADGLDEPQAAAIRPPTATTATSRSDLAIRRRLRLWIRGVVPVGFCTMDLPRSFVVGRERSRQSWRNAAKRSPRGPFLMKNVNIVKSMGLEGLTDCSITLGPTQRSCRERPGRRSDRQDRRGRIQDRL
jgi:hypothetical protein